MKKLFALFLVPVFLVPLKIDSTEKTISEAPSQIQYELTQTLANQVTEYTEVPKHPIAATELLSYKDDKLSEMDAIIPAQTPLDIVTVKVNDDLQPVFELSNGTYLSASQAGVTSDVAQSEASVSEDFWLKKGFALYQEPYYVGAQALSTKLQAYDQVHVIKEARTISGHSYYVENQGWVAEEFLSATDNRMEKVQELLNSKYKKSKLSIYVEQLDTHQVAGINQDKVMYSASTSKLPLLYYVQHRLNQGQIKLTDKVKYKPEVHRFKGAFDPAGAGNISKVADNKDYTIESLLKAIAQDSDNAATNILAYYAADKYGADYKAFLANLPEWSMDTRKTSAAVAGQYMKAIYEQNGQLIDYLSHTRFDNQRISKNIDVPVAHKIGDAYDYRHDVAIVYADQPFILSIFTENTSYDDISAIAKDIYTILK